MSDDLISRKAVIELIKSKQPLEEVFTLLDDVEELPTAYDVDKVVEQIQNIHLPLASQTTRIIHIIKSGGADNK